ncbi:MAG: hypothetical protein AAFZ80_08000 [Cyanobacteria bacterium P01_A01_bin.105]
MFTPGRYLPRLSRLRRFKPWGIGFLVSLLVVATHSVSFAADNLQEDSVRWLSNGEQLRTAQFLFADEPIFAACSQDCYDLQLTLHDSLTQAVVAQTREHASNPMLQAPYEGEFQVEVTMKNCARLNGCRTWTYLEDEE